MCSINYTQHIQQLSELHTQLHNENNKLEEINNKKICIENQINLINKKISSNAIYNMLNEWSDDIITYITKFLNGHSIANLYNTSTLFRIRIKNIYLIIVFKFTFDTNHNYNKIKTHSGMQKFACVFSLQYMKTHNIHIHYILANLINLYDFKNNKLIFKNNINIEEYSQIMLLNKIIKSNTKLKYITFENYKQFLSNYDIKYSSQNNDGKIKEFLNICKILPDSNNNNEFYYYYNHMKVFMNKYVPSIKSSDFRLKIYKKFINDNYLYYYMFGYIYDKIIDSIYILN